MQNRIENLQKLFAKGTAPYQFDYTWKEVSQLPPSWLDDAFECFIKAGMFVSLYSQQLQIRTPDDYYKKSSSNPFTKYEGVILTIDSWTLWMNTWWKIYYVLDDGSEIYGNEGQFIELLMKYIANGPVIMVHSDNTAPRSAEELKAKRWNIDQRKLIGFWINLNTFIPARFESKSKPNPYGIFPGKNRARISKGTIVNLTRLVRGDFDDHGVGILYHIKINTGNRTIYKIGLTKSSVTQRYRGELIPSGWTYEVLNEVSGQYCVMAIFEQIALVDNDTVVKINEDFAGKSECRGKPFEINWDEIKLITLQEAKILAVKAQYRSFL